MDQNNPLFPLRSGLHYSIFHEIENHYQLNLGRLHMGAVDVLTNNGKNVNFDNSTLEQLRSSINGDIVFPDDDNFDEVRTI